MKALFTWLLLSGLLSGSLMAQIPTATLSGRVLDAKTQQPLPFASVYLNNSTRGTTANEQGAYQLTGVPLGSGELVGSVLGYAITKLPVRLGSGGPHRVDLLLHPTAHLLSAVAVTARRSGVWQRQFRTFNRELLGSRPQARQCRIVNPNVLSFEEAKGHLLAKAAEPLVVENQALGYRLHYDLLHFDLYQGRLLFAGTSRFEELPPPDARQTGQWEASRLKAYRGSLHHLLASMLAGTYQAEGYTVYRTPLVLNSQQTALPLVRTADRQYLDPQQTKALFKPGNYPFERRFVSNEPLEVYYNRAYTGNSPYRDSPYAYSMLLLPNQSFELTTTGWVTQGNQLDVRGFMGQDRLATLLPADWLPTTRQPLVATNIRAGSPTRPDAPLDSLLTSWHRRRAQRPPVLYVQTDKSLYSTGDWLWFSVYQLDPVRLLPVVGQAARALQVELLAPTGQPVLHQWLQLTDGRGAGQLRLSDTLHSGTYRLRAYAVQDPLPTTPGFEYAFVVHNSRLPHAPRQSGFISATQTPGEAPLPDDWTLTATADSTRLRLGVRATGGPPEQPVFLTLHNREQVVYRQRWQLANREAQFALPTATLPPGLYQATLYDADGQVQAEQQVLLGEPPRPVQMRVTTSKPHYGPREPVAIGLQFRDEQGYPVMAQWSASVTDADQLPDDSTHADLWTYLSRPSAARPDQKPPIASLHVPAQPDSTGGWQLTGHVRDEKGRPLAGQAILALLTGNQQRLLRSATTDATGQFRLAGLLLSDTVRVRTRLLGEAAGAVVRYDRPGTGFAGAPAPEPDWAMLSAWTKGTITRQNEWPALYRDSTARLLNEVVVRATRHVPTPRPERPLDVQRASIHQPDVSLVVDDNNPSIASLQQMIDLIQRLPGVVITNGRILVRGPGTFGDNTPLYLIDGVYADEETVLNFNPRMVSRIELVKTAAAAIYGARGEAGVIAVFTRKGNVEELPQAAASPTPISTATVYGFVTPRPFAVPDYRQAQVATHTDRRDVLFWEAMGQTDANGLARLNFPLSDTAKRLRIVVQGVTVEGVPMAFTWLLPVR